MSEWAERKMAEFKALPLEEQERRYNALQSLLELSANLERCEVSFFEQFVGDEPDNPQYAMNALTGGYYLCDMCFSIMIDKGDVEGDPLFVCPHCGYTEWGY